MSELLQLPGYLIRRLHQIAVSAFGSELASAGLDLTPIQVGLLTLLRDNPGIDQATLSGLIGSDKASTGAALTRLEARGYIQRDISARDRRARVLVLTPRGQDVLPVVWPAVRRSQEAILAGLTPEEGVQLLALLTKAAEASNDISRAPIRPVAPKPDDGAKPPLPPDQQGGTP